MQYYNGLNMGEGIAGPQTIGASTTAIYTCMGIAFISWARSFGGLYHYPAKSIRNPNVSGTIRQMFNDIEAEEIALTPAADVTGGGGSDVQDIAAVTAFLQTFGVTLTKMAAEGSAQLIWVQGQPALNTQPSGQECKGVPERMRSTMSTGARELEGNVWYYGGDGEAKGVLDQNLKTTKQSAKGCCVLF